MKRLLYILPFFLIVACNNAPEKDMLSEIEAIEEELADATVSKSEPFEYATITEQKLQEYADLSILKHQHPEFAENIKQQMQDYYKDSLPWTTARDSLLFDTDQDSINVQILSQVGATEIVNDSVKKLKITFNVGAAQRYKSDTITAIITTNNVVVDGRLTENTNVTFTKE